MMTIILPRFFRSAYRKEPLITVLITMGVVDALIGGLNDSWSLFAFGACAAGLTLSYKWWRVLQRRPLPEEPVIQHYLPSRSSNSALPILNTSKKPSSKT